MTIPGEKRRITVVDATHLVAQPTELERARAHLRTTQDCFHRRRAMKMSGVVLDEARVKVLAALSWVWDAQERAERQEADDYFKSISRLGYNPTALQITAIPSDFWKKWKRANRGRASFIVEPPFAIGGLIHDYSIKVIDGVTGDVGLITGAEARRALRRQPGFLPRPTRRAAAPASRGRRRRS